MAGEFKEEKLKEIGVHNPRFRMQGPHIYVTIPLDEQLSEEERTAWVDRAQHQLQYNMPLYMIHVKAD